MTIKRIADDTHDICGTGRLGFVRWYEQRAYKFGALFVSINGEVLEDNVRHFDEQSHYKGNKKTVPLEGSSESKDIKFEAYPNCEVTEVCIHMTHPFK